MAEARVSRTHRRPRRTTAGFEDREDHRNLSAPFLFGSNPLQTADECAWASIRCVQTTSYDGKNTACIAGSPVRLTQHVKAGGCASKLAPGLLNAVLSRLPRQEHPDLLVGFDTADDAGVFRLGSEEALLQTVDFFTPMIDDPFTYGRIAATNALSDVYAMGGRPLTALALVCFPQDGDPEVLEQILLGGLATMREADCVVIGGHSVRDAEIKFGYAVTGIAKTDSILTNAAAKPGDRLIFTKALGTGVIATALKQGRAQSRWVEAATSSMTTLNRKPAEIVGRFGLGVHAMTDVTGFGLVGHAREMAIASRARLALNVAEVRPLEGALDSIELGCIPAGLRANRDFAECFVENSPGSQISETMRTLLYDPQTSGGLLISADPGAAASLISELQAAGCPAAEIGTALAGEPRIVLC
jgi:selenide,water dikinase